MSVMLPERLRSAVAGWLETRGGAAGGRRQATALLSATYRAGGGSETVDLASYLVTRLPATYAAIMRVLQELKQQRPEFSAAHLLDAGCGPGTASWAAAEVWPELAQVTLLDHETAMLGLAADLATHGPAALAVARRLNGKIGRLPKGLSADLVISAYALAEIPLAGIDEAVSGLWRASTDILVLVEPGTPEGFARLRMARDLLLNTGAVPVAPCPHASACPMVGADWCHFRVRLPRSRAHMHAKAATVPFEDEAFAYLIVARQGPPSGGARIIAPPRYGKPGIDLRLCMHGRMVNRHIARREVAAFRQARKLAWGDTWGDIMLAPGPEKDER